MNLLLATILSFSFTLPDSNQAGGSSCSRPVSVASSGDSVIAEWRAQPLFAAGGYMRSQVGSVTGPRKAHRQVFIQTGIDSATTWQITVTTARWGLLNGEKILIRNPCPRTISKLPPQSNPNR